MRDTQIIKCILYVSTRAFLMLALYVDKNETICLIDRSGNLVSGFYLRIRKVHAISAVHRAKSLV